MSLKQQLKESGFLLSDIDQVVLTPHHVDHTGLLDCLAQGSPLAVLGDRRNTLDQSGSPFSEGERPFFPTLVSRFRCRGTAYLPFGTDVTRDGPVRMPDEAGCVVGGGGCDSGYAGVDRGSGNTGTCATFLCIGNGITP